MLIKPVFQWSDLGVMSILAMIAEGSPEATEIVPGVYEIGHFSGDHLLAGNWEKYPALGDVIAIHDQKFGSFSSYGVCDNYRQILAACPELAADETRKFCIMVTKVVQAEQPPEGGWRWHKWGPYIGSQRPEHEYLYDEDIIDHVYCYHIYEKMGD